MSPNDRVQPVAREPRAAGSRVPLPPIAHRITPKEWAFVAIGWLLLALSSVVTLTDRAGEAGFSVATRDFLVLQTADWIGWMVIVWPLFRLLDATPIVSPNRLWNLVLRGGVLLFTAAAHTAITYPAIRVASPVLGLNDAVWKLRTTTPSGMYIGDIFNLITPLIAYALLRRMYRRRLELVRAADLERSLLAARLHALDLELRPHFLFNTLNMIVGLVKSEPDQAERMLVTLSDLLRVTLGQSGEEVTLRDELDQLDLYVDIQRVRFGERLKVKVSVDADVLDACVPPMLLQPLVENALTHGLASKTSAGMITINALLEGGDVAISVADDGVGLPASGAREGTGTGNTRQRLHAMYGIGASFTLHASSNGGTEALLRFPYRPCTNPGTTGPRRIHQHLGGTA